MGNVSKKLKRWKWPLGAAGVILVAIGLNTVRASPEFAAALAVSDNANDNAVRQSTDIGDAQQDGAEQWVERRGRRGMRGQQGGGMDGGFNSDRNGGSVSEGSEGGGGFRSSTRTS